MNLSRRRIVAAVSAAVVAATTGTVVSLTLGSPAGAVPGCVTPPDFAHSIPAPLGGPAATPTEDAGVVTLAAVGGDRKVYAFDTEISSPDGLAVSELVCLGGGAVDTPTTVDLGASQAFFVVAPNQRLYQKYVGETGAIDGPWTPVPGAVAGGSPTAVIDEGGLIRLFVRGTNGALYSAVHDPADPPTTWSPFQNWGGSMTGTPAAGLRGGVVTVAVRAPNGAVYTKQGPSGAWRKLVGTTSASPTIASGFSTGRLDLFITGTTGGLYQSTFATSSGFTAFKKVDPDLPAGAKVAAAGQSGSMLVFTTFTFAGESYGAYTQYLAGFGWSGLFDAPYSCDDCLPQEAATASGAHKVERKPVR